MKRVLATIAMLGTVALAVDAQTTITGRVVADESGDSLPNARVSLASADKTSVILTDGDGRFVFPALSGRSTVIASKSGYARSEATPAIAGQPIEIRLRRGATISGRIVDEFGDPALAVRVVAEAVSNPRPAPRSSRQQTLMIAANIVSGVFLPGRMGSPS
jgi:hypothetical protein